jgi:hypothetical protein
MRPAFAREITWLRAKSLAYSALVCLGRRTVTGMLATSGRQFQDWTADYRLFQRERMDLSVIFKKLLQRLAEENPKDAPVVAALDDTILKKTGRKTAGSTYRRDPLGPPFQVNLILGQRFVQLSAALFEQTRMAPARMVPLALQHAPTPPKPKKHASDQERQEYQKAQKQSSLSRVGLECIRRLREDMDQHQDLKAKPLIVSVDGSYTNETCLKNLPPRTTLIGRIRKDAKLHFLPDGQPLKGRKRKYGPPSPTPEEIRRSQDWPYQRVTAFSAGKLHHFRVKIVRPLRWPKAGGDQNLQLMIIAPLGYRLTKQSKLLYRQPAYIICTNPDLKAEEFLQFYLWRWGIEVNFRDQKTILGLGQAQVRTQASVAAVPALITAAYAILLLAAKKAMGHSFTTQQALPPPKWQSQKPKAMSTQKLINQLKAEMWGDALGMGHFSNFEKNKNPTRSPKNWRPNIESAVLYQNH